MNDWGWLRSFGYLVTCWGLWVAVWLPLWMAGEAEIPGQQYADPVLPVYVVSFMFAGPTFAAFAVWKRLTRRRDPHD
jgi:hypothetical protein